jgi:hypothetical protein
MLTAIKSGTPRVVSGLAIVGVAVAAGVISYQHVEDLTLRLHGTLLAARLMPVGVDGLIAVGSMIQLQGGLLGWVCIGPGVAISLFANIESGIRYGWLAAIWAGIPAVSFALASFVLERWIAGQVRATATPLSMADTKTVADAAGALILAPAPAPVQEALPILPETQAAPPDPLPRQSRIGMSLDEAAHEFESEIRAGTLPSKRAIRARCHTGAPRAQEILEHLALVAREHHDALASAPGWMLDRSRDSVAA